MLSCIRHDLKGRRLCDQMLELINNIAKFLMKSETEFDMSRSTSIQYVFSPCEKSDPSNKLTKAEPTFTKNVFFHIIVSIIL